MARNNDMIYNAAFAGCLSGQVGQGLGSGQAAQAVGGYATQATLAAAYAAAVDAAIPYDNSLSVGPAGPAPILATTGAFSGQQFAKVKLINDLSYSAWLNRNNPGAVTGAALTNLVASVVAAYNEGVSQSFFT